MKNLHLSVGQPVLESYLSDRKVTCPKNFEKKKPLLFYKYTTVGDNMCIDQTSPFYYLNRSYRTLKSGHNVYYNILFKLTVDDEFSGIKQMKNNDENFDRKISWTTHVDAMLEFSCLPHSPLVLLSL